MTRLKNKGSKFYGKSQTKIYTKKDFWVIYSRKRLRDLDSKKSIASFMNMSLSNLYNRLREEPKLYDKTERKFSKIMRKNN